MTLALCWNSNEDFADCLSYMQNPDCLKLDTSESMIKFLCCMPTMGVLKSMADTGGTHVRILGAEWSVPIQEYQGERHSFSRH